VQILKNLEEFVLLAQVNRLLPAIVALVQVCADSSELDQLVLLQPLSQRYVVKVVESVDGRTKTLVIFFFNEKVVQCLVDRLVVVSLQATSFLSSSSSSSVSARFSVKHLIFACS